MNLILKIFLSMSFSGGLLILALLFGKRLLQDRISRQWQYYIWMVAVLRLLLPFGPEINLMGKAYQAVDQVIAQTAALPSRSTGNSSADSPVSAVTTKPAYQNVNGPAEDLADHVADVHPLSEIGGLLAGHIWLVWLAVALGLLIRKITIYQSFVRYINAGLVPVSDMRLLDCLAVTAEQCGMRKPVELCVNPLVSSPLLMGFFRPCIVLPGTDISERDFQYIVLHELTHHRRLDIIYKWLVQVTVCLHWFNPLVHLMSREINRACEFSCDEAVLTQAGCDSAQDYGKTLLDAMAAVGKYKENLGAVTLSENKQLLKERLGAIMKFKERSKAVKLLTAVLTACVILGASFIGIYPAAMAADIPDTAKTGKSPTVQSDASPATEDFTEMETLDLRGTTYYLVQNEAQLRAIGTGEYGMDLHYMQQADIVLSADEWVPIGTRDNPFTGTFNGNGFEIIGLTMTDPYAKIVGLFGVAKDADIYNVTMRDEDITSAGRYALSKSVGAVLAIGGRSHDNTIHSKEDETTLDTSLQKPTLADTHKKDYAAEAAQYYEADSMPLFQIAFSHLDENAQREWLDRIYKDQDIALMGAVLNLLKEDCAQILQLAETIYQDDDIAFFSNLTMHMSEDTLEAWLDRALEDEKWAFQAVLYNALDWTDDFDALKEMREKEWDEAMAAEYEAVGVTFEGKNCYYEGHLVNIFLDMRAESFYTLDMNPAGTVNIKILRDGNNKITGVAYMTEAEVEELFGES